MRYRKLDENRDMTFGNQQNDFYRDVPEAPAQSVLTRLGLFTGEWYVDISEGTPYQGGVLGKHTQASYDPILRDRILNSEGVSAIFSYESIYDGDLRTLTVRAEIDTIYGSTTVVGVL